MTGRDTIAAIASPPGLGGIGLIRVSGPEAEGIARRLFSRFRSPAPLVSHRLCHSEILSPETGTAIDDTLVAFLKGPHTYTGEDTLEISCHGSPLILRTVLEEVFRAGARPADRGEFTKRAFLNDRIDLSQAEAVLDLIHAQTAQGLSAAVGRLKGKLSGRIEVIRNAIIDLLAGIEAAIDFSEEESVGGTIGADLSGFQTIIDDLQALLATYRQGRIYREGVGVVIAGRPNVGKSSHLNSLLGHKRAIVTPIPGTTRDFIEETLQIGGIAVRLTDTAGIHPTEDVIEKAGIDLVWEQLAAADAVLVLLDGSMALTPDDCEIISKIQAKPMIPVINKSDLPQRLDERVLHALLPDTTPPAIRISAKYGNGIDRLIDVIQEMFNAVPTEGTQEVMIADIRHKVALEGAVERMLRARDGLRDGLSPEFIALEVRDALDSLGEINGAAISEEVLDRIFANFCIGK
jgi:tRNA modification GTPase